jgi:tetratricopeptide (TPR) repeat protein
LSAALFRVGRTGEARPFAEAALEVARKLGDRKGEAAAERALGNLADDAAAALGHADRALKIFVELGDRHGEMTVATNKGLALRDLRRYGEALEFLHRALEIAREIKDRRVEGGNFVNLGGTYAGLGQLDEAEKHYERGRTILREIGNRAWEARALSGLGRLYVMRGLLADALATCPRVLELSAEVGDRTGVASANGQLASVLLALGRPDEAQQAAERLARNARELDDSWDRYALWTQARCAEARGDLREAEDIYRRTGTRDGTSDAEVLAALLAIARLRPADAPEILRGAPAPDSPYAKVMAPALLGDAEATRAAIEEHGTAAGVLTCMEGHFRIDDVEKAHELLVHLREHAPEDYRESILENVPLHREIMEAYGAR